jgi:hypothetical protein
MEAYWEWRYSSTYSLTAALDVGEWSASDQYSELRIADTWQFVICLRGYSVHVPAGQPQQKDVVLRHLNLR